jgi:hypothetical protein
MEDRVLHEVMKIRSLISQLVGTNDLPVKEKFSKKAIAKAAKEFQKLSIERGEWLASHELHKIFDGAYWDAGKTIIEKFEFTNYFKRGSTKFFNRKDLIALKKELKEKNINLKDYIELLKDQEKFEKLINNINLPKGTKTKKHFKIPASLKDIHFKPYMVSDEPIRKEIEALMEEFKKFDLSEYIHLYESRTQAYFKYDYSQDRYLKPELKKYCKDWCFKFNYANNALKRIDEIKVGNEKLNKGSDNKKTG